MSRFPVFIVLMFGATSALNEKMPVLRNCEELRLFGFEGNSTSFLIDPDGENQGIQSFPVECELSKIILTGKTIITPNSTLTEYVNGYEARGSFIHPVDYPISMDQLVALMTSSLTCKQYMKYECHHSELKYAYWRSRDGQKMNNWGSPTEFNGCMCGFADVCEKEGVKCNCDINDETWRLDEGYVDDMSTLPVTKLQLGDTGRPHEYGNSTIGPLECTGTKRYDWNIARIVHNDFCLVDYVLSTFQTVSSVQCAFFCRRHALCKSFNIKRSKDGGAAMICELNYKLLREVSENRFNTISGCANFEPNYK